MNTYAVYNAPINGLPQYGWVDGGAGVGVRRATQGKFRIFRFSNVD